MALCHEHIRFPLLVFPNERTVEVGHIMVISQRINGKKEVNPGFDQSHPEFIVLTGSKRGVEPSDKGKQFRPKREVAAKQIAVCKAIAGLPHCVELALPPIAQSDMKKI